MGAEQPLSGHRFLVPRAQEQAAKFAALIEAQGGEAVCIPTIEIVPPVSWAPLDLAMRDLDEFDILILTSTNGVEAFFERLFENNQYIGVLTMLQVVAVGPKTAEALRENRIRPNLVPEDHRAEGVVAELLKQGVAGKRILYPRAELARPYIIEQLTAAGAEVVAPIAYRTLMPEENATQIRAELADGKLDAICLSSPSTFNNLLEMLGADARELLAGTRLFSIGPQTSEAIRTQGYQVDLEPERWTLDSLVQAMVGYYSK